MIQINMKRLETFFKKNLHTQLFQLFSGSKKNNRYGKVE